MTTANLPPGRHDYDAILRGVREGVYRFARVRTASGRLHPLIGVTEEQLRFLRAAARSRGVGFCLLGSRVSGPRARQRELHPLLAAALPLHADRRTPSHTYPGAEGVRIDKTAIKEHGPENVHTSDLTVLLVDPRRRPRAERDRVARELEEGLRELGTSFPVKVFASLQGRWFDSEADVLALGSAHLRGLLPAGAAPSPRALEEAFRELYATVALPRRLFTRSDWANGAWNALLASVSFSIALGFHPAVAAAGFGFGLCGRYLGRLRAWISRGPGATPATNTLALLTDAGIGFTVMAAFVNPLAGFGIPASRILWASALHTLSKGSVRLWLDKRYSGGSAEDQRRGVFLAVSINFLQGLATSYIYAGSAAAAGLQCAMAAAGLTLAYRRED